MSESKHTPGPWTVERIEGDSVRVIGADGTSVVMGEDWPERLVNAHLIAAAPELLAALQGFVGLLKTTGPRLLSAYTELLADAEAAIKKAEGQ